MAVENVADRAAAYGMPGEIVDGNDVLAVWEASRRAIETGTCGRGSVADRVQDVPNDRPLRAR